MDNIVEGSETMNIQKFTQKSIEAVNDCEKLAYDYGNQEIEQEQPACGITFTGGWTDTED